jgi:lysophospholipid acyltransferase (LPLAT)-like uncharacterized protein
MLGMFATYRIRVLGWEHIRACRDAGRPILYAFWHGEQFALLPFHAHQSIGLIISHSRDGARLAELAARLGYVACRGSSSRGGVGALVGMIQHVRKGNDAAITLDGPKGPFHEPKPGLLTLAYKTGATVIPLRLLPTACWRFERAWDQYFIPKPFSRLTLDYRPPLALSGEQEADLALLKEALRDPVE